MGLTGNWLLDLFAYLGFAEIPLIALALCAPDWIERLRVGGSHGAR